jgi:PKHD-type hydroxylase
MIKVIELLSKEDCNRLKSELEKYRFTDGKNSATGYAKTIKENFQLESTRTDAGYIFDEIKNLLGKQPFLERHISPVKYPRMFANYYAGGHHYDWHADAALMSGMRTDFSFTISLQDPDTYEGGALEMELDNGKIESFRLPEGHMILYPTGQLHRVTEVTAGFRLSIVGWMQSAFGDADDRALRAELLDLIDFLYDEYSMGWEHLNRFNKFKQKLVRRLLK